MVRTQIQLPEEVYARAKRFCKAREMSLAELARRGVEMVLDVYPAPGDTPATWDVPVARRSLGWRGLDDRQLKDLAQVDSSEDTVLCVAETPANADAER